MFTFINSRAAGIAAAATVATLSVGVAGALGDSWGADQYHAAGSPVRPDDRAEKLGIAATTAGRPSLTRYVQVVTAGALDRRSPDTRDAAAARQVDLRSPDTRDASGR